MIVDLRIALAAVSFLVCTSLIAEVGAQSTPGSPRVGAGAFNESKQPLPENGETVRCTEIVPEAPFTIKSSEGSHYLVKLCEASTGKSVLTVFVHGGEPVKISVPFGDYIIKYASGINWYGYTHYFGPETSYAQADDKFSFKREINADAAERLVELSRDLILADKQLRQYLTSKGFEETTLKFIFDGKDTVSGEAGADRFSTEWWSENVLKRAGDVPTYNGIIDRLNARNKLFNNRNSIRSASEKIVGYTITLYKVKDGNLATHPIDAAQF